MQPILIQRAILDKLTLQITQLRTILETGLFCFDPIEQIDTPCERLIHCYEEVRKGNEVGELFMTHLQEISKNKELDFAWRQTLIGILLRKSPNYACKIPQFFFLDQLSDFTVEILARSCEVCSLDALHQLAGLLIRMALTMELNLPQLRIVQKGLAAARDRTNLILGDSITLDLCKSFTDKVDMIYQVYSVLQVISKYSCYPASILAHPALKSHIKIMLSCSSENKHQVHALALDLLSKIDKCFVFQELFGGLSSYGIHLIKDVWVKVYFLLEEQQEYLFSKEEMLSLVFLKLKHHENANVSRNCTSELLLNPKSSKLFQVAPGAVYHALISLLNLGLHYLDTPFHMDSKTQVEIRYFFANVFNKQRSRLQYHLTRLLDAIDTVATFDHTIVALVGVFEDVSTTTLSGGDRQVRLVKQQLRKHYQRFPPRKRFQLVDGLLAYLVNNLGVEVEFQGIVDLIGGLDQEYLTSRMGLVRKLLNKFSLEVQSVYLSMHLKEILQNGDSGSKDVNNICRLIHCLQVRGEQLAEFNTRVGQLLHEHAESQFKIVSHRLNLLRIIPVIWISSSKPGLDFLEDVLNCVVLAINQLSQTDDEEPSSFMKELGGTVIKVAKHCYFRSEEAERVLIARFIQCCSASITHPLYTEALVAVLRIRATALRSHSGHPLLLEDALFSLPQLVSSNIRLTCLVETILLYDAKWAATNVDSIVEKLPHIIQIYDYSKYEQVSWLLQKTFIFKGGDASLLLRSLLDNMVVNLGYSLREKEVIAIVECSFSILNPQNGPQIVAFLISILELGRSYFLFERVLVLNLMGLLYDLENKLQSCLFLLPLLREVIVLNEYRGYDSAVHLHEYSDRFGFYSPLKSVISAKADYLGTTLRLTVSNLVAETFTSEEDTQLKRLLQTLFEDIMEMCLEEPKREKMFLCGKQSRRLKMWQFLLSYPLTFFNRMGDRYMGTLLERCVTAVSHDTLAEVRYYSEMFLLRLVFHEGFSHLLAAPLYKLAEALAVVGSVNKNVSYMVITGLLVDRIASKPLASYMVEPIKAAYNALLVYTCSSIAYFRGLAQYFCFNLSLPFETKYVQLLRANYLKDPEAAILRTHLQGLISQISFQISSWNAFEKILMSSPNENGDIVSADYHMDRLRALGNQLLKEVKHVDGFCPYKDIWKSHIMAPKLEEEETVYQIKIEPIQGRTVVHEGQMEVLLADHSATLAGHLCRTGEIFGVSKLWLPSKSIIEEEEFKNIAATADKWLPIGFYCGNGSERACFLQTIIAHKLKQYTIYYPDDPLPKSDKCLMVLDSGLEIRKKREWSMHVTGAIAMWEMQLRRLQS